MREFGLGETYAGAEPFDERLLFLRFLKNIPGIVGIILAGTALIGSLILLGRYIAAENADYEVEQYYHFNYITEPVNTGDTSIIYQTWEIYVSTPDFLEMTAQNLKEISGGAYSLTAQEIDEATSMTLPTDIHVPCATVTGKDPELVKALALAFNRTLEEYLVPLLSNQITDFETMNTALIPTQPAFEPRLGQSYGLAAVLMTVLTLVIFCLWELGLDSIFLPATLRKRYGLSCAGSLGSEELPSNLAYALKDAKRAGLCTLDEEMDPMALAQKLPEIARENAQEISCELVPVPAPILCTQTAQVLRTMDAVVLAVPAGIHSGKPLDHLLDYFKEQGIAVTTTVLTDADEKMIRSYYRLEKLR